MNELLTKERRLSEGDFLPDVSRGVAKSLALKLGAKILAGEYEDGQRLPAERDLATEYAVSRTTLRRGLDILENSGLVVRKPGSGTFINAKTTVAPDRDSPVPIPRPATADTMPAAATAEIPTINLADVADLTSPLELIVVRSILEPEIARLTVINMSSKDISKLRAIIERMDAITTDAVEFSRCDEDFYSCLAEGTRNPLLIALYKVVTIVRSSSTDVESREKLLSPNRIREYKKNLRSLFDAICSRDIESAVEFVKLQMTEVQRDPDAGFLEQNDSERVKAALARIRIKRRATADRLQP